MCKMAYSICTADYCMRVNKPLICNVPITFFWVLITIKTGSDSHRKLATVLHIFYQVLSASLMSIHIPYQTCSEFNVLGMSSNREDAVQF